MDRALWISATGMEGQTRLTENIANNLANVNTTGYKKGQVHFQDMFYQTLATTGSATADGNSPVGIEVGSGSRVSAITRDFGQGTITNKTGDFNMAIVGDGFFEVDLPDGSLAYTRDGHFHRNENGIIVTDNGYPVKGFPTITTTATSVSISETGKVSQTVDGVTTEAGQLTLSRFPNSEGLKPLGSNLYGETPASGSVTTNTPGTSGTGLIRQGFLESSNVEVVKEMVDMIAAQRAYEIISKSIKTSDEMLRTATNLK